MTNRLINSQSLYLRKHAENPIDWWYWGQEPLTQAKQTNKPIFLSIGYSSCHWCTVMEGEAFSNLEIAQYLKENFIAIKLDREERPDIDSIYMLALQAMTGQGGWPLNIFLTPDDLVPFYGGTYFPVEPRYGRPGFLQILQSIHRFYHTEKQKLQSIKNEINEALQESTNISPTKQDSLNLELLSQGIKINTAVISSNQLGSPSFPMIPYADLTLRGGRLNLNHKYIPREIAIQRGIDLALGGICDHVGGGFHRYTVDATWTVPHFEKMLYDNGQIVEYLANLWSAGTQEPEFARAIAHTVKWLKREMTAPEGYFYAAQDADNFSTKEAKEPEEGAFYVWEYTELQKYLTVTELEELITHFSITPEGNFEGTNVLQREHQGTLPETVETTLDKLFYLRYGASERELETTPPALNNQQAKNHPWAGRIPPVTDTKMIVAWNSLMISGLARASSVFDQPSYGTMAAQAANFILKNQRLEGQFHRLNYDGKVTVLAQSEDYALFIKALLDLHQSDHQPFWLEKAIEIQQEFDQNFFSLEFGGYYNTRPSPDLLLKERSYVDSALPSANGVGIANLVRLGLLTEDLSYLDKAELTLKAFVSIMNNSSQSCPSLFTGLDWYLNGSLVRCKTEQITQLVTGYFPHCVYLLAEDLPRNAVGIVCQGLSCLEPAPTLSRLLEQIKS